METEELREERKRELEKEVTRLKENVDAFHSQHLGLLVDLKEFKASEAHRVRAALENTKGTSAKGLVDKVLQLSSAKEDQLLSNIEKTKIAFDHETEKMREAAGELKSLKDETAQEKIDVKTKQVFDLFHQFIDRQREVEDFFYNKLLPCIEEGYNLDLKFHYRAQKLGLSTAVMTAIDSHLRPGSFGAVNLSETLTKIASMGEVDGERLLEKQREGWQVYPGEPGSDRFFSDLGNSW